VEPSDSNYLEYSALTNQFKKETLKINPDCGGISCVSQQLKKTNAIVMRQVLVEPIDNDVI
jgi:hypothetical protein